ncbi:hypothetical protein [Companilactobacillus mishanensis]|uniref:hypothetical protein n=1 Tax=Companilactobacillus mishanensis TaxID=2486008 RepID=UPI0012958386|nr:hypothetical protein [Companilactobacillus mishanensis]MQS90211.1 hypothetical protein [Companilactobacillus mishanensis]
MRFIFILVALTALILLFLGAVSERPTIVEGEVTEDTSQPDEAEKEGIIDQFLNNLGFETKDKSNVTDQTPLTTNPKDLIREEKNVKPMHPESSPAIRMMGWYFKAGYSLQPKYEYWLVAGKEYVLRTKIAKNSASFIDTDYNWFQYTGNGNWQELKHEHSKELTFSAEHAETRYYQATAQVWPRIFNPLLYSRMTKINFLPKPVAATSLKITSDSDYIYVDKELNYQSIFVDATPNPENATGEILYSVREIDRSLATIDPHTGELFPNTNGQEGEVKVIATLTNEKTADSGKDFKEKVTAEKFIQVTHLLTGDKQVYANSDANFQVNGDFDSKDFKIEWYRIEKNGKITVVKNNETNHYKIESASVREDDKIEIFAKISEKNYKPPVDENGNIILGSDGKPIPQRIVETNHLRLNVITDSPKLTVTHYIRNKTNGEYGESLDNVAINQELRHDLTLVDSTDTANNNLKNQEGKLIFKLSKNEEFDHISSFPYKVSNYELDPQNNLIIFNKLKVNSGTSIFIHTNVKNINEPSFTYKPTYKIQTAITKNFNAKIDPTYADFSIDELIFKPSPIKFGKHYKISQVLLSPENKSENPNFVNITDHRRIKEGLKITVKAEGKFHREIEPKKYIFANMFFRLFKSDNTEINLKEEYPVITSAYNETIESIPWSKFDGLRLFIEDLNYSPGEYKSTLLWNINNAP